MRIIYIDSDYKCHTIDDGTNGSLRAIETEIFDGMCNAYIEGYRFVPKGEKWIRDDGAVFHGEMVAPWKDYKILEAVQTLFDERNTISEASNERIAALEEENAMLLECILEMSEIIYA